MAQEEIYNDPYVVINYLGDGKILFTKFGQKVKLKEDYPFEAQIWKKQQEVKENGSTRKHRSRTSN